MNYLERVKQLQRERATPTEGGSGTGCAKGVLSGKSPGGTGMVGDGQQSVTPRRFSMEEVQQIQFPCAGCEKPLRTFDEYFAHGCPELGEDGRSLTVDQWMQLPFSRTP